MSKRRPLRRLLFIIIDASLPKKNNNNNNDNYGARVFRNTRSPAGSDDPSRLHKPNKSTTFARLDRSHFGFSIVEAKAVCTRLEMKKDILWPIISYNMLSTGRFEYTRARVLPATTHERRFITNGRLYKLEPAKLVFYPLILVRNILLLLLDTATGIIRVLHVTLYGHEFRIYIPVARYRLRLCVCVFFFSSVRFRFRTRNFTDAVS